MIHTELNQCVVDAQDEGWKGSDEVEFFQESISVLSSHVTCGHAKTE
jgi:hypothetical protein